MNHPHVLEHLHQIAEQAAREGSFLDAYDVAARLCAEYPDLEAFRSRLVDTIIAAGVVYGAPMLLDPRPRAARSAPAAESVVAQAA